MSKKGVKPYSLRNFPASWADRVRELAAYETKVNREKGQGKKTIEGLLLEIIDEGLTKRETARKKGGK